MSTALPSSKIVCRPTGAGALIEVSGVIDQTFSAQEFARGAFGVTVVDLGGVTRITSFGVREWSKAMELLSCRYLGFVNVHSTMVTQFNVVARFAGSGQLVSVYAPYLCSSCGEAFEKLFDLRTAYSVVGSKTVGPQPCPKCGASAEFDDVPSTYFTFAAAKGRPSTPPEFDAVREGRSVEPKADPTLKIQIEVEDDTTLIWLSGALDASARFRRIVDTLEGVVVVMLEAVTDVTAEGLTNLSTLFNYEGVLHLARFPLDLVPQLESATGGAGYGVGTLMVRVPCPSCGAQIRAEVLAESPATVVACPSCGASTQLPREAPVPGARPYPVELLQRLHTRLGPRGAEGGEGFLSRFEILQQLGHGGMGEVFLARMKGAGGFEKNVALKHVKPGAGTAGESFDMLLSEARLAARLTHQNIVQILDVGVEKGEFFIAMEYVKGLDLRSVLQVCRTIRMFVPAGIALYISARLCAALEAAHTYVGEDGVPAVIVHRDVSPHNVMLSVDGAVKLTDFGVAKMDTDPDVTPTAVTKGKLLFLAPEQIQLSDRRNFDPRSDIFAAGVVCYQALALVQPFHRDNEHATLTAILHEPVPSVRTYRPELPPQLDQIIARATAKKVEDRYQTVGDLRRALEALQLLPGLSVTQNELAAWVQEMMSHHRPSGQGPGSRGSASPTPRSGPGSR